MSSKLIFKVVALKDNKEVASEVIGWEILSQIAAFRANWKEGAIHAGLHQYLIDYPHPAIWRQIAGSTRDKAVFDEVLKKRDIQTLTQLASNEDFVKHATQAQLVQLIEADAGIALEIARNRQYIAQNDDVDIKVINDALESLKNYEVDQILANDSTYRKLVVKLAKHPDPFVAAEARAALD